MTAVPKLLRVEDVMAVTRMKKSAAYALMKRIPGCVYIGSSVRVPEWALTKFVNEGGDACDRRAPTSTSAVPSGGAGSTTTRDAESRSPPTSATERWRGKLLAGSNANTLRRQRPKPP